jgi:hypothetical protein
MPAQPYRANGTGCTHTSLPSSTSAPAATRGPSTLVSNLLYGPLQRVVRLSAILIGGIIVLRHWRRLRHLQLCLRWRILLRDEAIEGAILPAEEVRGRGVWEFVNCREALQGQVPVDYWYHFVLILTFWPPYSIHRSTSILRVGLAEGDLCGGVSAGLAPSPRVVLSAGNLFPTNIDGQPRHAALVISTHTTVLVPSTFCNASIEAPTG